jgi:hypothetical protein
MATSKDNIRLGGFKAYYGTLYLGQCSQDGVTINRNGNAYDVMTALTGEGIFKTFSTGESVEIDLTLLEFDKYLLEQVLGAIDGHGTDPNNAMTGKLTAGYSPGIEIRPKPLLIYPTYVDANNQPYEANANNQFCFGLISARPGMENEIMISPTEETSFPITFVGQYDTTRPEGQRVWFAGAVTAPANSIPIIS